MDRRVVLERASGERVGICEIIGLEAALGRTLRAADVPTAVRLELGEGVSMVCDLMAVEERYVFFKERVLH